MRTRFQVFAARTKQMLCHDCGIFFAVGILAALTGCQTAGGLSSTPSPAGVPRTKAESTTGPGQQPSPRKSSQSKPGLPTITARAALLVDHRGRILYEKNADMRLPTASTQKLLLGILITDRGNLDQIITVSSTDTRCEPTKLGIQPGQSYRKGDLLKVVLVRSSNDVARCLARNHSGSVSAFAGAMNARARQLGMFNSHFTNASGLPTPPGQYSTAKDLAILANAAMKRPAIRDAVGSRGMIFRFANGTTKTVYNTNQVLRGNPYCTGCKTGYTSKAGRCLISSASDGRKAVIAVILGSKTPQVWSESDALLRYGLGQ